MKLTRWVVQFKDGKFASGRVWSQGVPFDGAKIFQREAAAKNRAWRMNGRLNVDYQAKVIPVSITIEEELGDE